MCHFYAIFYYLLPFPYEGDPAITITAITRGRLLLTPMVMTSVRLERPMTCAGWTP